MPKTRTTVTLDDEVVKAVKMRAARTGMRDSEVIEGSLRRDLHLDALEEIWGKVRPASEAQGLKVAAGELGAVRKERRGEGRP